MSNKLMTSTETPKQESNWKKEPMTENEKGRLCLFPVQHADIYKNFEDQVAKFWTYNEIEHGADYKSWCDLNKDEQHYIAFTLSFFANSDNAVLSNISTRFRTEIMWPEVQLALSAQAAMESIHIVSYNNMINTVIKEPEERIKLFHAVNHSPIIAKKIAWIQKWAGDPDVPLHVCFVAQCFSEGIGFSPSFASMFWLRKNQKCPGICFGNEKIVEDEALHVKLFALLYKNSVNKMSRAEIVQMCEEFVAIEHLYVDGQLPYNIQGMNKVLMKQFVCRVADTVLELLGEPVLYNVINPFPWMEGIGLVGKTNFFEKTVGEYQKVGKETEINTITFKDLGKTLDF
jgi:ribonucleotide reductase beta subunit family protein with ferritin-like domain